jgi:hypothetical protein
VLLPQLRDMLDLLRRQQRREDAARGDAAAGAAAPPLARVDLSAAAAPAAAPLAAAPRPPVLADAARGVPHDDEMRRLSLALRERLERKAYLLRNHAREERRPPIPA